MNSEKIKAATGLILIIVFFIIASYIVQINLDGVKNIIGFNTLSIVLYILILFVATVIAPISAIPLMPIASNSWGWFLTAIFSIIGWTTGALFAFALARKFGMPLVRKFVSLEKISRLERYIPEKNIFWSIVFLRMSIPVDILSYILGLFSQIRFRTYALATLIGVSPFAFLFAYLGTLPLYYQVIALFIAVIVILIGIYFRRKMNIKSKYNKNKSLHDLK